MKSFNVNLLKKTILILSIIDKQRFLLLYYPRITGNVLRIAFTTAATKFNLGDFVKTSKKLRSNFNKVLEREPLQYDYIGICIAQKKDPYIINTSFLVRNAYQHIPFELRINLFNPVLDFISVHLNIHKFYRLIRNKYYYLRNKPVPESVVNHQFALNIDHDQNHDNLLLFIKGLGDTLPHPIKSFMIYGFFIPNSHILVYIFIIVYTILFIRANLQYFKWFNRISKGYSFRTNLQIIYYSLFKRHYLNEYLLEIEKKQLLSESLDIDPEEDLLMRSCYDIEYVNELRTNQYPEVWIVKKRAIIRYFVIKVSTYEAYLNILLYEMWGYNIRMMYFPELSPEEFNIMLKEAFTRINNEKK